MLVRFDVRRRDGGWCVVDTRTGRVADVDGVPVERLDEDAAGEIADLLNTLAFLRTGSVLH